MISTILCLNLWSKFTCKILLLADDQVLNLGYCINRRRRFRIDSWVRCAGAHLLFSTLSRRGLNPIRLAYSPSPPDNGLGQYASSPGKRGLLLRITRRYFPNGGRSLRQYSFCFPTEGWPGWVERETVAIILKRLHQQHQQQQTDSRRNRVDVWQLSAAGRARQHERSRAQRLALCCVEFNALWTG